LFSSLKKNPYHFFIKSVYCSAEVTQDLEKGIKQLMEKSVEWWTRYNQAHPPVACV